MTTTTMRRARPSVARRRRSAVAAARAASGYERTRAAVILSVFILVFGLCWLMNGEFTARLVMRLFGGSVAWGWAVHITLSAVEVGPAFLKPYTGMWPRWVVVTVWLLSLPFGIFDVFSTAGGIAPWFVWTGAGGLWAHVQNVVLAEVVAFLPEPMLMCLTVALCNVLRSR